MTFAAAFGRLPQQAEPLSWQRSSIDVDGQEDQMGSDEQQMGKHSGSRKVHREGEQNRRVGRPIMSAEQWQTAKVVKREN